MGRPRLLAVGPALDQSSYARVVDSTLAPLAKAWDTRLAAINYRGPPIEGSPCILPNPNIGDRFGIEQVERAIKDCAPDVVFIFNSFVSLPRYRPLLERLGARRPPIVAQCPLLGEVVDPRRVAALAIFDCVIVLSEGIRDHVATCFETCRRLGLIGKSPDLAVLPHGFDRDLFYPLADRRAVRGGLPTFRDLPGDAFVVLNANQSDPRKHLDLTLRGFARFARDKPPSVRLQLHIRDEQANGDVGTLIRDLDLRERIMPPMTGTGRQTHLDDHDLNRLYNACDVGLNTSSGEGWGMISFEHAATGAAQIVPGHWICGDLWRGHAELLEPAPNQFDEASSVTRCVEPSIDSIANALERLFIDLRYREQMSRRAEAFAIAPHFQWTEIAARLDQILRKAFGP